MKLSLTELMFAKEWNMIICTVSPANNYIRESTRVILVMKQKNISHSACFYTDDEERQVDDTVVQYYCFECTSSSTHNNLNNKAFNRI